jgi:hypothetical protein
MESWNEQLKTKILESEFSVKEISDKTKIPTKFIKAIETADFKKLPAEIFAKSQIERLFKFLGIDPTEALKDYEEFVSPPDVFSEGADLVAKKPIYQNFLDNLNFSNINNTYIKYGSILLISIFLLILMFAIIGDEEKDFSENNEIEKTLEFLENENIDLSSTPPEEELFIENENKNDLLIGKGITEDVIPEDITRKIEIDIEGESWVVVFDKNERLLYELLQNGSYELSGISPLRFKIGYSPATNLYIDDQKINFSRAIKGASNYAHFWLNEANKVESIKD